LKNSAPIRIGLQPAPVNTKFLETDEYRAKAAALRGSVMLLGPILARFGKASIPKPGGDKIGRRRLDTHFHWLSEVRRQIQLRFYRALVPH
jgi:UDP-N-acetylglucosamine enolpyruvyl transferase